MKEFYTIVTLLCSLTSISQVPEPIIVTTQSINITGSLVVGSWMSEHPKQTYPDYPKMYYGFAEGDEIVIDIATENKKGTQGIEVTEFESKSVVYSNHQFKTLDGIRIKVPKTSVYKFEFGTNHVFDRQAKVTIKRIPASDVTKSFNCNVTWETINDTTFTVVEEKKKLSSSYEALTLQTPIDQYVNSGRNALLQGGKSRIICPITLPENTVEWYYTFATSRSKNDVASTKASMKLFSELAGLLDRTGILSLGVNALTQPPGADYCDVYLLKPEHFQAFLNKDDGKWGYIAEGTKENLKLGIVRIKNCCTNNTYYLGFKTLIRVWVLV
ncbi:hypothetical protein [Paraflavitalea speifideaquila]|uniref:hypothetical protein n=1 Tax=Paraflavitalea speifideaquila TaxID=3076558 RepID=UPI0028E39DD4|nr:hypothetical protein [Paraflavitalea speifideiaquila]